MFRNSPCRVILRGRTVAIRETIWETLGYLCVRENERWGDYNNVLYPQAMASGPYVT